MFDARDPSRKPAGGLGFGLLVLACVSAVFFTVLYLPSLTGPGKQAVPGLSETGGENALLAAFEDEATRIYLGKLQATFPSAAAALERDVRQAARRDADEVELGLLVLRAGAEDIASSIDRLGKAETRYFNELLDISRQALTALSQSGAPYCKGSDLIVFAGLSDQELYRAVFDRVGHGSGLYEFALEFNGVILDAIRSARRNPVLHGPLNTSDQQALQRLAFAVMANSDIMKLLSLEGKSRREMDEAVSAVNFCTLGATLVSQVDELPEGTKGRLWAEVMRQIATGEARRTFYRFVY